MPDTLVCSPYTPRSFAQLAGNQLGYCRVCRDAVVISTEGQDVLARRPGTAVVCLPCAQLTAGDELPIAAPGVAERVRREGYAIDVAEAERTPLKDWPGGEVSEARGRPG